MRQVARKGLITAAAASGVLAMAAGYAQADAGAAGGAANSPGVGSGNNVQVPVHVPVNACGNTVNVVALLNPAFGNRCANDGGGRHQGGHQGGNHHQGGHTGAGAAGTTANSPGVVSGNNVQAPVDVPVNACGNNVSAGGLLNPAFGNHCANGSSATPGRPHHPSTPHHPGKPHQPGKPHEPGKPHHPSTPHHPGKPHQPGNPSQQTPHKPGKPQTGGHSQQAAPAKPVGHLAQTGAGSIGYAVPASAGMLLGGVLLYRKTRAARR